MAEKEGQQGEAREERREYEVVISHDPEIIEVRFRCSPTEIAVDPELTSISVGYSGPTPQPPPPENEDESADDAYCRGWQESRQRAREIVGEHIRVMRKNTAMDTDAYQVLYKLHDELLKYL